MSRRHLLATLLCLALAVGLWAQTVITRGPYIQMPTESSVTVRWRTAQPMTGEVRWGPSPEELSQSVSEAMATEHEVEIAGLEPGTRHFYAVSDGEAILAGGDEEHFFRTHPPIGARVPVRLWAVGDFGWGNQLQVAMFNAFLAHVGDQPVDAWLMLGDNAYPRGTDAEFQRNCFEVHQPLLRHTAAWPALGNHDAMSARSATQTGPHFDSFTMPTAGEAGGVPSGTEAYYSFDIANVHLVCLDSEQSDRSPGSPMLTWLEEDLTAADQGWLIAYFHSPPYSHGSHNSDNRHDSGGRMFDMRENAVPIIEAHGADLVLVGHSHNYERSFLLRGHFGTSDTLTEEMILDGSDGDPMGDDAYVKAGPEGTVYAVVGSGGEPGPWGSLDHPAMCFSTLSHGSLIVEIEGAQLTGTFVDARGEILDRFAIVKPHLADASSD